MKYVIDLIDLAINAYILIIFIYVLMSYFPNSRGTKLYYTIARICEPLLNLFRWAHVSGISFAPMLASISLIILRELIYRLMIW